VGALAVAVQDSHTGQRLSLCITFPISAMDKRERGKAIELLRQEQKNLMRNTE
jgi:DNA-binding IclR family transcriptional regulator